MNLKLVLRVVAVLLVVVTLFMLTSLIPAWYYGEEDLYHAFLIPAAGMLVLAAAYLVLSHRESANVSTRDGFLMVTLSWIAASALGAFPMYLSGAIPRYVDAYFETMSGFTTTGASILTAIESLPKSILFWRSLTHWLGGMGIIVLTVAIFPLLGIGGLQLLKAEAPGPTVDKIAPRVAATAKILWLAYLALTVAETALLMLGGMDLFDALTHTFGTLATGGFSPKNASVGHYASPFIHIVITVFMVMAGINFALYYRVVTGRLRSLAKDTEFKAYLAVFAVATVIVSASLYSERAYSGVGESLRYGAFQVASILTTTGYATADFDAWPALAQLTLFVLMFFGGCAGSTGGGIKIVRVITMFRLALNEMRYMVHPRGVFRIKMSGQTLRKDVVYTIAGFVVLYISCLLLTTLVVATGGYDITTSFSTALVTLGNIGPGFALVGPTQNYFFFPDYIKWFLSFIMMLGRLEVYTVLVILVPRFWRV
ncbi:MAG: TrkH family potassium uptake protein [Spirochaetaceae bacterium]